MAFAMNLYELVLEAGQAASDNGAAACAIYVAAGSIQIGEDTIHRDNGIVQVGSWEVAAKEGGACLWCWEIAADAGHQATKSPSHRQRLCEPLKAVGALEGRLLRLDSVAFPAGGCAYLHTHQGPGIRCLIEGTIRIDSEGHSTAYGPGLPWFEAGPEPVFAQADNDVPTRFIRAMLLPKELLGKSSIHYVSDEDRDKPKSQTYRVFSEKLMDG